MNAHRLLAPLLALAAAAFAQDPSQAEKDDLRARLAEANSSEIEVLQVIRHYLKDHPATQFRPDLEKRAALAAAAIHDDQAVVLFGVPALDRVPNDSQLLPPVTHALLETGKRDDAGRARDYARRTEELVRQMQRDGNPGNISPTEWRNRTDLLLNRALADDARATGILGHPEEALTIAQRAFETYPDANAAREIAFWFEKLGKTAEAIRALADAFTIPDAHAADEERAADRALLGELYRKAKGSEDGLGALCLEAYDRNATVVKKHEASLHAGEPNAGRSDVLDFTLSAMEGESLRLSTLRGRVVVMDIWATWCIPCRAQHPLYEEVKQSFQDNPSVVFLSVNSDPDRSLVKSFVTGMNWQGPVYYEDGLARLLNIDALPSTIVLDRGGKLVTHLIGYVDKARFVEVLTQRIRDALAAPK